MRWFCIIALALLAGALSSCGSLAAFFAEPVAPGQPPLYEAAASTVGNVVGLAMGNPMGGMGIATVLTLAARAALKKLGYESPPSSYSGPGDTTGPV